MPLPRTADILNVGNNFATSFRLQEAPSLLLTSTSRPQMAMTRITLPVGMSDPAGPVHIERAFTISVHLRRPSCQNWGTWVDGKFLPVDHWDEGGIGIYDLESDPRALRPSAFDSVHFNVPRATLEAFTVDNGLRRVDTLSCPQGARDDVLFGLARFILPWLSDGVRVCDLTFDYFVLMVCSRLATTYGSPSLVPGKARGLTAWQQRRVMNLINADPQQKLGLSTLADACGLSVSHFSRSFKQSFGIPVHRYVIHRRIDFAKHLLKGSSMPLAEIALRSGFSDQAAFSRTFAAAVGVPPKRWLNEYKCTRRESADVIL